MKTFELINFQKNNLYNPFTERSNKKNETKGEIWCVLLQE